MTEDHELIIKIICNGFKVNFSIIICCSHFYLRQNFVIKPPHVLTINCVRGIVKMMNRVKKKEEKDAYSGCFTLVLITSNYFLNISKDQTASF